MHQFENMHGEHGGCLKRSWGSALIAGAVPAESMAGIGRVQDRANSQRDLYRYETTVDTLRMTTVKEMRMSRVVLRQ